MTLISLQNFQVELICLHLEGQVKASVWKYLFKKLTPTCSFSCLGQTKVVTLYLKVPLTHTHSFGL